MKPNQCQSAYGFAVDESA